MKTGFTAREDFCTDKGLHPLITSGKPNFPAPSTNTQFDLTQSERDLLQARKRLPESEASISAKRRQAALL
ncbi:hypothetical protein [Eikenella corrodens]|uniref:hypothetical protein n=1 Tax=Eikenella corrodens TaxID=539 RepID=UPI00129B68B0|nr:hypothetical protein [Eikenella corrodens]